MLHCRLFEWRQGSKFCIIPSVTSSRMLWTVGANDPWLKRDANSISESSCLPRSNLEHDYGLEYKRTSALLWIGLLMMWYVCAVPCIIQLRDLLGPVAEASSSTPLSVNSKNKRRISCMDLSPTLRRPPPNYFDVLDYKRIWRLA